MLVERHSDSSCLTAGVSCDINKGMHRVQCQNSLLRKHSLARVQHTQLQGLQEANRVTETTNVGESNGTNLKPIPPILFFKQAYEYLEVLILRLDSWCEWSRSISTPYGREVLKTYEVTVVRYFWLCCIKQQMLYVLWNSLNTCSPESVVILLTAVVKSGACGSQN
jgi:hypothetical protein